MSKSLKIQFTLVAIFLIQLAYLTNPGQGSIVKDCSKGATGKVTSIHIKGCDLEKDQLCKLVRNQTASISAVFSDSKDLNVVKVRLAGKKAAAILPFPLKPEDACGHYGFDCPIKANEEKELKIELPVLRSYPKMKIEVQLRLVDEHDAEIICFRVPSEIVDE